MEMNETIKQIANRLKGLREAADTTIETLANFCEISAEKYKAYETGNLDIPISILFKVARYFNIDMTVLLSGEEPHMHSYCFVRKNEGIRIERSKLYNYKSLAYNFIHRKVEPMLVEVEPKDENDSIVVNNHSGQEFNYVLEGRMKIHLGNKTFELSEGDAIYFDSSLPHGMIALDNKKCKFLAVII